MNMRIEDMIFISNSLMDNAFNLIKCKIKNSDLLTLSATNAANYLKRYF